MEDRAFATMNKNDCRTDVVIKCILARVALNFDFLFLPTIP